MSKDLHGHFRGPVDWAFLVACDDRASKMLVLRNDGVAVKLIAQQFGVSYQRVIQITNQRYSALLRHRDACQAFADGGAGSVPIKGAGFSTRATNAMLNECVLTVGEAAERWEELRAFFAITPNVGRKTIAEIEARLLELGFPVSDMVRTGNRKR